MNIRDVEWSRSSWGLEIRRFSVNARRFKEKTKKNLLSPMKLIHISVDQLTNFGNEIFSICFFLLTFWSQTTVACICLDNIFFLLKFDEHLIFFANF